MANKPFLDIETLRQVIRYDPVTGKLFWLPREISHFANEGSCKSWNTRYAGAEAITTHERGYRSGNLLGRSVYAHRIAWALVHGEWPEEIDHINQDRSDNRIVNLRDVSHVLNLRNFKRGKSGASGVTGVYFDKRECLWAASIGDGTRNGKNLGRFASKQDAIIARKAAEIALQYHPNHGR